MPTYTLTGTRERSVARIMGTAGDSNNDIHSYHSYMYLSPISSIVILSTYKNLFTQSGYNSEGAYWLDDSLRPIVPVVLETFQEGMDMCSSRKRYVILLGALRCTRRHSEIATYKT